MYAMQRQLNAVARLTDADCLALFNAQIILHRLDAFYAAGNAFSPWNMRRFAHKAAELYHALERLYIDLQGFQFVISKDGCLNARGNDSVINVFAGARLFVSGGASHSQHQCH
jgi:hypothetical protein